METSKKKYLAAGDAGFDYAKSIGKSDLASFTEEEWLYFCESICEGYKVLTK